MTQDTSQDDILVMASDIVAAYVSANQLPAAELAGLIRTVHGTLGELAGGAPVEQEAPAPVPAVSIKASVRADAITCLDCGKAFKTLKRHLNTEHGLSPADYKDRWGLEKDYPLVAPAYSKARAKTAKKIGLGRKPKGG